MAKTKHAPAKRRRRHAPLSAKKTHRRKPRKRGLLGDIMNPTMAMHSAKSTLAASGGGLGAVFVNKMLPATMGKAPKMLISLAGGFLLATFGMPSMGAGLSGGMTALAFQNGLMGDDMEENEFADGNSLEDMPLYLDESGEPFVIEEGEGESYTRYLSDEEKESIGM